MSERLVRPNKRVIGGVCEGLGRYIDADPTIIRILFAVGLLFGVFPSIIIYIICWILIPSEK